jgi:hypothetical protein
MVFELFVNKNLISKVVRHNNVLYILFKSGNEVLYKTIDNNQIGNIESFKNIKNMDTEHILQNKYLNSGNDFQLVREQLLPKPNLR